MANDCNWDMNIIGTSKKDIIDFIEALNRDYADGKHLWRVWEVQWDEDNIEKVGSLWTGTCFGTCAWSVHTCMLDGEGTYQGSNTDPTTGALTDPNGSTIYEFAKMFNVTVEIFSSEPGACFEEHYLINNQGQEIINESVKMEQYYWDGPDEMSLDEFNEEYGTSFTEKDFYDGCAQVGGFRDGPYDTFPFLETETFAEEHTVTEWDLIEAVIKDAE